MTPPYLADQEEAPPPRVDVEDRWQQLRELLEDCLYTSPRRVCGIVEDEAYAAAAKTWRNCERPEDYDADERVLLNLSAFAAGGSKYAMPAHKPGYRCGEGEL